MRDRTTTMFLVLQMPNEILRKPYRVFLDTSRFANELPGSARKSARRILPSYYDATQCYDLSGNVTNLHHCPNYEALSSTIWLVSE